LQPVATARTADRKRTVYILAIISIGRMQVMNNQKKKKKKRVAVRGHRSLLIDGHILHRDISVNIKITMPSQCPRTDGYHGFMIDLDHAIGADFVGRHSTLPERTRTIEFMSTDALECLPSFRHIYYVDLQSFMWVFFWLIIKDRAATPTLKFWSNHEPDVTGAKKEKQFRNEESFEFHLTRWLDADLGVAVVKAAKDPRKGLWPPDER